MFCANIVKGHWSLHRTQNHFQIYAAEFAINQRTPHDPRRSLLLYVLHLNFGHLSDNLHRGHQKTDCINSVWKVTVDRPATYWTTPMVLSADLSNHLSCLNSFNKIHRAQDASRTSTRGTWQPNGQEVFGWMTSSIAPTDPTGRRLLGTCDRVQIYLLNLLWYTLNLDGFRYIIVSN